MNLGEKRKYGAIYADLPWHFRNWSAKGTGRNAVSHYDCMDFEAMARLPVQELAAEDCVLFLWAIDPLLPKALELVAAWGFEYKTVGFYWVKQNKAGEGFFTGLWVLDAGEPRAVPSRYSWQARAPSQGCAAACGRSAPGAPPKARSDP